MGKAMCFAHGWLQAQDLQTKDLQPKAENFLCLRFQGASSSAGACNKMLLLTTSSLCFSY